LAVLAAADQAAAPAPMPDVTMGQAQLAKQMGDYYRSIYAAPGMGGAGAAMPAGASAAQSTQGAASMPAQPAAGGMYGSYAPMGAQVGQTYDGAFGGSPAQVQAQQAQLANEMGKFYRSQFVPPGMEQQIAAQQAAQAQQQAAQQAPPAQAPKEKHAKESKPEVFLAETGATATTAPVPMKAENCTTMDELKAWYKARIDTLKKYVPKAYQSYASKSIESEYDTNKKRIEGDKTSEEKKPAAKGPLMFLEDKADEKADKADEVANKAGDKADAAAAKMRQWKGEVKDALKKAETKADGFVDEVSSALKKGFDSATSAVDRKANSGADQADKMAQDVKQRIQEIRKQMAEQQKKDAEKKTAKDDAQPTTFLEAAPPRALFMLPLLAMGGAAFYLHKRRADDELVSVYHMQV